MHIFAQRAVSCISFSAFFGDFCSFILQQLYPVYSLLWNISKARSGYLGADLNYLQISFQVNTLTTTMEKQPSEGDDAFHHLVQDLSRTLGTSSGFGFADIEPQDLQRLMAGYNSRESDWLQYAWGDPGQPYTRNLVDNGNGRSNLVGLNRSLGILLTFVIAHSSLDSGERKPYTRPRKCSLCNEGI